MIVNSFVIRLFFFNDTATTEIYTLSLHDALPICINRYALVYSRKDSRAAIYDEVLAKQDYLSRCRRSEEHTSELQSRQYLVCRLLLEKKKLHLCQCTNQTKL